MNSLKLIASGMAGALAVCLMLRFAWASLASKASDSLWRASSALNELLYVGSHALIGGGLGWLFWLSWGFTALADLPWWQQGLGFGLGNAIVFGLAPLLMLRSLLRIPAVIYGLLIVELVLTCAVAGMAASWTWKQGF